MQRLNCSMHGPMGAKGAKSKTLRALWTLRVGTVEAPVHKLRHASYTWLANRRRRSSAYTSTLRKSAPHSAAGTVSAHQEQSIITYGGGTPSRPIAALYGTRKYLSEPEFGDRKQRLDREILHIPSTRVQSIKTGGHSHCRTQRILMHPVESGKTFHTGVSKRSRPPKSI